MNNAFSVPECLHHNIMIYSCARRSWDYCGAVPATCRDRLWPL